MLFPTTISWRVYWDDQWVSPSAQLTVDIVDRESGKHGIEASIEVWKADIEALLERPGSEYWCECHAWNSHPSHSEHQSQQTVTAKTHRAVVQAACECVSTFFTVTSSLSVTYSVKRLKTCYRQQ